MNFELPSVWNLIISTLVFFVVAWYLNRYLDAQEIGKSMTRGMLVFSLASLVSWGAGEAVDLTQGSQPASQASMDLSKLLKASGQPQP